MKLNVFALFHLNLAFSSIEEEQRGEVIARCYWPLLRLPGAIKAPIAIEATGYTLESIAAIDPAHRRNHHARPFIRLILSPRRLMFQI